MTAGQTPLCAIYVQGIYFFASAALNKAAVDMVGVIANPLLSCMDNIADVTGV
jgi:hypothetical protein